MLAALTSKVQPDLPSRGNDDGEAKSTDRRRDWLSFLTWSFFLAELAGREGILAPGAHAGESDAARPSGRPGEDGAAADSLPVNPIATDAEEPTNTLLPQGPTILNSQPSELLGEAGDADIADAEEIAAQRLSEGSGGGGGGGDIDRTMGAPATDAGDSQISLALGQPLDVGGVDLQLANGVLDGLGNLLPGVQLDVPLIADLLGTATYSIGALTNDALPNLSPILSIGGLGDGHGGNEDATGSAGHLNFADPPQPSDSEGAPSQHGYSDYGIALNLSFSDPEPASSTQSSSDAGEPASFDHGDWQAPSMGATSDALHADDAVLRIAGDTLA